MYPCNCSYPNSNIRCYVRNAPVCASVPIRKGSYIKFTNSRPGLGWYSKCACPSFSNYKINGSYAGRNRSCSN